MSYLWNEFNIKTFPAETIVYRDGAFCRDLSTIADGVIPPDMTRPIHIIYVGNVAGENRLDINVHGPNQRVYLTAKIKNKKPAFLNIFIKNAGKSSSVRGGVLIENNSDFSARILATHLAPDTKILIQTKLIAGPASKSKLGAVADIQPDCPGTESDIAFSALAAPDAKIEFIPSQRIHSIPTHADHSAALYHPSVPQIQFLRSMGLSGVEVNDALRDAFANDFDARFQYCQNQ